MPSTVVLASRYGLPLDTPPEFVWGYADTMRMDSVRPSCMECVEKHLGAALVLMGEAEAGYPEHKLLAIGHLHEAAEESADMRPELSALLRDIRKRYQQGEAIEFETILEALNLHGVWRFDQRGQGVACGNSWIPRSKKCSRDKAAQTSKEAKAKTVEKAKARAELKRAVKAERPSPEAVQAEAGNITPSALGTEAYTALRKRFLSSNTPDGKEARRQATRVAKYNAEKKGTTVEQEMDVIAAQASIPTKALAKFSVIEKNRERLKAGKGQKARVKEKPIREKDQEFVIANPKPIEQQKRERAEQRKQEFEALAKKIPVGVRRALFDEAYREYAEAQGKHGTNGGYGSKSQEQDDKEKLEWTPTRRPPMGDKKRLKQYNDRKKMAAQYKKGIESDVSAEFERIHGKTQPRRTDSYLQGYLEVMSWRFDRKGEGVACGRGWISRQKKCGRDKSRITSPEAKARTVEKQKERQQLRGQVKAAKGMKPYVKPKQEPDAPQGMPHKNPKTPQEFIENGRAVAGAFLANAKKLDSDIAAQQQAVADGVKRVNEAKLIARQEASAEVRKTLADDPKYQEARRRQEEQKQLFDEVSERYARYEATSTETNRIAAAKIEADLVVMQIRDRKIDELVDQHTDVAKARKARDEAQQKLTKLTSPAVEFKQQLISTSTMPRADAEARAKKVKKPPTKKDPGLSDQIADFNQLTNGAPTTLNRITITEKRAHATHDGLARYHGPGSEPTLWHEMAHHLEYADPAMAKVAEDWVKSRATGPEESLRKLTGNNRYDRSEKAYPDHFIAPYVGKVYEGGATEVLSMGLETFSSPERMIQLAAKDPDHFALVLGLTRRPE